MHIPYLVCHCPPCLVSLLSVQAVLAELQQASAITGGEGMQLSDVSAVVRLQSQNSPEVMVTTAEILRRHGFEKESEVLSGWPSWHFVHSFLMLHFAVDSLSISILGCIMVLPLCLQTVRFLLGYNKRG